MSFTVLRADATVEGEKLAKERAEEEVERKKHAVTRVKAYRDQVAQANRIQEKREGEQAVRQAQMKVERERLEREARRRADDLAWEGRVADRAEKILAERDPWERV